MRKTGCQEIWAEVCHRFPARFRSSYLILPPDTVSPRDKVTGEFVEGLLNKEAFLLSRSHPGQGLDVGAETSPACKAAGVLLPPASKIQPLGQWGHIQVSEVMGSLGQQGSFPTPSLSLAAAQPLRELQGCLQAHALCRDQHFFGQCIVFANGNWQWKKYSRVKGLI